MSTPAIVAALLAALSWAVASIAIGRLLHGGKVSPAAANLFKNSSAAACFFVAAILYGGRWPVGHAWGWLFLSGFLGFAVADSLYFAAFQRCGVQTAASIMLLNVPIAVLLAVPLAGDTLASEVVPFVGVVLLGVLLVVFDRRLGAGSKGDAPRTRTTHLVGVGLALCAALAIGTAVPLGRGRFDEIGVCPGGFVRLAGGAVGAVPLAVLVGFQRDTSPANELGRLLQPILTAPGPASVWSKLSLFGVGCAVLGLAPYHYALRELPGGVSALLFASTPLFTLPLAILLGQRAGVLAFLGTAVGFAGVGGILLHGNGVPRVPCPEPAVAPLDLTGPAAARLPTFLVVSADSSEFESTEAGTLNRPVVVVGPASDVEDRTQLKLVGAGSDSIAPVREIVQESAAQASGDDPSRGPFFVNWADVPRAARLATGGGLVAAHLEGLGDGAYAYGIRLTLEEDGPPGRDLGWLHTDESPAEHGFVSVAAEADGSACFTWLDGRTPGSMQLFSRVLRADGQLQSEVSLDGMVCDCCPTSSVLLADGALVVAYRDRTPDEVRDIAYLRREPDGATWSQPALVHSDNWLIPGCPVNGPAIAASGDTVAIAWFTRGTPEGLPEIRVAFSDDGGRSFDAPEVVARGDTLGLVALAEFRAPTERDQPYFALAHLAQDAPDVSEPSTIATWVVSVVGPGRKRSLPATLGSVEASRRSGRLDLVPSGLGTVDAVWVEGTALAAARITLPEEEALAETVPNAAAGNAAAGSGE